MFNINLLIRLIWFGILLEIAYLYMNVQFYFITVTDITLFTNGSVSNFQKIL